MEVDLDDELDNEFEDGLKGEKAPIPYEPAAADVECEDGLDEEAPIPYEPTVADIERLQAHLSHAATKALELFRKDECLTKDELTAIVKELPYDAERYRNQIRNTPPEELKLADFGVLSMFDPEAGAFELRRFRQLARSEIQNGTAAAKALYGISGGSFWEAETFKELLSHIEVNWKPQTGLEQILLQNFAQACVMQQRWTLKLSTMGADLCNRERVEKEHLDGWLPPRVTELQAMDQAAAMIERFNRMALINIRTLKDLRRSGPTYHIDKANIANQQIVVDGTPTSPSDSGSKYQPGRPPMASG